ncbi:MAG: carboxypeptidase regulatory-like domain-containing protein [Candidatus Sulfotelmatobacter sp.]
MLRRIMLHILLVLVAAAQLSAQIAPTNFRISGKAVNAVNGEPLAHTEVSIAKAEQFDVTLQRVLTADDGAFSFTGLEPGKYLLIGQRNGFTKQGYEQHGIYVSAVAVGRGLISENLVFRLRPDAWIAGTIIDEESEAIPNAMVYLFRTDASSGFKQTFLAAQAIADDRGYYRFSHLESGWYFVVVSAQPWFGSLARQREAEGTAAETERALDVVYPTSFYPGAVDSASASQIALNEGEGLTANFTLTAIPALHVRIHRLNSDPEQPRGAGLVQNLFGTQITPPSQGTSTVDDSVELTGIPPGRYVLQIQAFGPVPSTRSIALNLSADMDLDADAVSAPFLIRGTIRMDGGLSLRPQAFVRLWNSHTDEIMDTQIAPNGEFSFQPGSLLPGNYSVFVMNGQYSTISKLSATGAKVMGQSIQIIGSTPVHLNIELPPTLSKINGTALRNGKAFAGAMIVCVPENPENNLPLFRRDQSDSDGTFTLPDVLPGRYKILAIENGWDFEWANPELLKSRLDHAESAIVQPNMTYNTVVDVK